MARNPDRTWPSPWWAVARDCELLEGRKTAEARYGSGYFADDNVETSSHLHLRELSRRVDRLYALLASNHAAVMAPPKKPKPWTPADGLSANPAYRDI